MIHLHKTSLIITDPHQASLIIFIHTYPTNFIYIYPTGLAPEAPDQSFWIPDRLKRSLAGTFWVLDWFQRPVAGLFEYWTGSRGPWLEFWGTELAPDACG